MTGREILETTWRLWNAEYDPATEPEIRRQAQALYDAVLAYLARPAETKLPEEERLIRRWLEAASIPDPSCRREPDFPIEDVMAYLGIPYGPTRVGFRVVRRC